VLGGEHLSKSVGKGLLISKDIINIRWSKMDNDPLYLSDEQYFLQLKFSSKLHKILGIPGEAKPLIFWFNRREGYLWKPYSDRPTAWEWYIPIRVDKDDNYTVNFGDFLRLPEEERIRWESYFLDAGFESTDGRRMAFPKGEEDLQLLESIYKEAMEREEREEAEKAKPWLSDEEFERHQNIRKELEKRRETLVPFYFRKEVLDRYSEEGQWEIQMATPTYGTLLFWARDRSFIVTTVPFGINEKGYVEIWKVDYECALPDVEKPHWDKFLIDTLKEPKSKGFHRAQIEGEFPEE
jgi:hypothetical protein